MDVVTEARNLKNRAMNQRDVGNWQGALDLLADARRMLEQALEDLAKGSDEQPSDLLAFETSVRKQLYQLLGSIGGVYRRRAASADRQPGDLETAIKLYDAGCETEKLFPDSYNLTQRLVTRVMLQPSAALTEAATVAKIDLREEMRKAKRTIEEQTSETGPRKNDEYAFADAAMIAILLGEPTWMDAVRTFTRHASKSSYARTVTVDVFKELAEYVDPSGPAAALRQRIEGAVRVASL
jgi:tetratricopeptide (TPR) repeat protein